MISVPVLEPAKELPVIGEYDLCVLGGSCTGVFAAIRAARLGLSVAIVERMGCFGGAATLSLINVWHTKYDERFEKQVFAGLTLETIDALKRRNAVTERPSNPRYQWAFNSSEMQIELDEMILRNGITPWLHTAFAAPHVEDGKLAAVIVENKSGRAAIRARFFIDATGDGDLCHRLGLETFMSNRSQPSTTCALFSGWDSLDGVDWPGLIREFGEENGLPPGFAWGARVPGSHVYRLAATHVYENCSDAAGFGRAEIEGRRQVRAIQNIIKEHAPEAHVTLQALSARIGIRETRHVRCRHQLTGEEILYGKQFRDAIAYGSNRVDIHHTEKPGTTFRYLDGREVYTRPGCADQLGRWRPETTENPTYYQIPYGSLVPEGPYTNLLAAGRFIDADEEAHAAIRVMVTMNQTGEAAGTAAFLALRDDKPAAEVDSTLLRFTLAEGGSLVL